MNHSVARALANYLVKEEVNSMSLEELIHAAQDSQFSELCNAAGGIDVELLLDTIILRYGGNTDLAKEFIVNSGIEEKEAEKYISDFMS